jgi:hypothetical protein
MNRLDKFAIEFRESCCHLSSLDSASQANEDVLELVSDVYTSLITMLCLNPRTHEALTGTGISRVIEKEYRSCPSLLKNIVLCSELKRRFGRIDHVPGILVTPNGTYCLNLRPNLSNSGIVAPVRDRNRRISALRIFRSARDSNPFLLNSKDGW